MFRMEHDLERRWSDAVAETLRAERAVAKLNQVQVADRTGISRSSYRLYEEGKRQPTAVQLAAIAEAFRVRLSYLVSEMERRTQA